MELMLYSGVVAVVLQVKDESATGFAALKIRSGPISGTTLITFRSKSFSPEPAIRQLKGG
jgi:hypothetical protein